MDLAQIEKRVWEKLKHEMTFGGATLSKSEHAIHLTFRSEASLKSLAMKQLMHVIPKVGQFVDGNKLVLAPIDTPEQRLKFAELKASIVGTRVVKHQEKMIELLASFKDSLQELKDLKVEMGIIHEA